MVLQGKILIVEDNALIRTTLSKILGGKGYTVVATEDGLSALQTMERESFDLILADKEMPRLDGEELHKTIRKSFNQIPFIMFSAYSKYGEYYHNKEDDFYFFRKSVSIDRLLDTIRYVIFKYRDKIMLQNTVSNDDSCAIL